MSKEMLVQAFIDADLIGNFLEEMRANTVGQNTLSFLEGEDGPEMKVDSSKSKEFIGARVEGRSGFFVKTAQALMSLSPRQGGVWRVAAFDLSEKVAIEIIETLRLFPVEFAFACTWGEFIQKNKLVIDSQYGTEESWVGLNYNNYIPGIYWKTLIKKNLLNNNLESEHYNVSFDAYSIYLERQSRADQWHASDSKSIADAFIIPIFDKENVEKSLIGVNNFLDISDQLRRWD
ncbi:MAG TPA: hypothetical protein VMG08_16235 [Allosphingosinicella sp.]|nr:hypothetical protein [Allosphingosinicella sp.]